MVSQNSPRLRAVVLTGALILSALTAAAPAAAADPDPRYSTLRLCDTTGCYIAWRVMDSDHDGVCDADEIMAGSDPYDPASRPLLTPMLELAQDRKLPSFEAGLGVFVALPQEILDARAKSGMEILGAFGMESRRETIAHLGLTFGEVTTGGVDLDPTHGFTIGLAGKGGVGSLPGARVGGVDAGLISAGTEFPQKRFGQEHGGVKSVEPIKGGTGTHIVFVDGATQTTTIDDKGTVTKETTNFDGSTGPTTVTERRDSDGGSRHQETSTTTAPDGTVKDVTTVDERRHSDGGVSTMTTSTRYVHDADGNVTGTVVTTVVSYISADGEWASTATTVEECDASGGNCTETSSQYEDPDLADDEEYVNPDADTTIVTFEAVDKTLRTRGAAVTVMPGWTAPGFENDPANPRDPSVVALVDSDLASEYLLVSPARVTKAQPEYRDDLPNPGLAAPTGGSGTCGGLCS